MGALRWIFFDVGNTLMNIDYEVIARLSKTPMQSLLRRAPQAWLALNARLERAAVEGGAVAVLDTLLTHLLPGWDERRLASLGERIDSRELWRIPNESARETVERLRHAGIRLAVISNSDGTAEELLETAGWGDAFEFVIDSQRLGVSKPDPSIFVAALELAGTSAEQALYVGDLPAIDIRGALRAGLSAVLYDPDDNYPLDALPQVDGRAARCHRITAMWQLPYLVELLGARSAQP
ncbi:HAD family hydrolase [Pseudomonas aeruginosa]|uniref:HAD family hydrolase n=1 Tax=Pseudomonas aeruginosa TaxID=287 RepID=UPI0031E2B87D